ncbi:hypothetical protein [Mycobacterium tuberculosis]
MVKIESVRFQTTETKEMQDHKDKGAVNDTEIAGEPGGDGNWKQREI